jgi:hypothetical protein
MGKGVTRTRSLQRKHEPDMKDWKKDMPTSLRGIANRVESWQERVFLFT